MEEIVNKVAQSSLETFDLEDFFPKEKFVALDISQWLFDGILLKEKEYREAINSFDFSIFNDKNVGLYCSSDAILPSWAFLLVSTKLIGIANKIIQGNEKEFLIAHYQEVLNLQDFTIYQDKAVILKGCSHKPVPQEIYVLALCYLQPFAKSIMYGEACSAVPVYKKGRN
jgi:Protein of unknown function (DUF2480)